MYSQHGMTGTPLYRVWDAIKTRCNNPNHPQYKDYGGRGISICSDWLDFQNFYNDMIVGYKKGLTIDRIDNDGNYEATNCKWSTKKEQQRHTRANKSVASYTKDGKLVKKYEYQVDVRLDGFNQAAVSNCCYGKQKTSGGLIWKFI